MKYTSYKMTSIMGDVTVKMPVDPAIEKFIGASINEKLQMALGIPLSQQIQGTLSVRDIVRDDTKIYIINIDDALSLFRELKAGGFTVKRGNTATGNKGSFFYIYSMMRVPVVVTTILIDVWRHTPRGQVISAPLHTRGLDWKPPK